MVKVWGENELKKRNKKAYLIFATRFYVKLNVNKSFHPTYDKVQIKNLKHKILLPKFKGKYFWG